MSSTDFVVCINNEGLSASLEVRKIYEMLPDSQADQQGLIRVVDESGSDYLFPSNRFIKIELSKSVADAVMAAA